MKKYFSLVKLLFTQQYRVKPSSADGKRKRGGTIALFIILPLCFLPMLIGMTTGMYFLGAVSRGLDNVENISSVLLLLCQGVVLVFGLTTLISTVFSAKDADKLLYLPVRSSTIFAAKLTVVYLNEVITTAVMLIVTLLPFGIGLRAGAAYFALLPVALLLVPLLPMLIGSVIAIPMSAIIAKFGKNGIVKTVLQIILFVAVMALYMFVMYQMGLFGGSLIDVDESNAEIAKLLLAKLQGIGEFSKYVHSNYTLASAMLGASGAAVVINLLITLGENVLLFGLVLLMALPFYHWILTTSVEGVDGSSRKRKGASQLQVKSKGVVRELIFTDIKRVVRDGQMGFQCIMSLLLLPLMALIFYLAFNMDDGIGVLSELQHQPLYQVIAPLVFLAYMSLLGITGNVLGIYPISRENNSIYIIKSLPLPFSKYLLAKVILATSAMLISDTIMCILVVALFGIQWYYGLLMLVTMALLGFGAMCITTLIDLKSPKLGWTNFNQSLKNAKNSWFGMLIGLICLAVMAVVSVIGIVGWSLTHGWYMLMIMWLLIIGLAIGFAVVSYKIMKNRAQSYFDNIEP